MSDDHREALQQELAAYETRKARSQRRESAAAEHWPDGAIIELAGRPLGWDWRVGWR